MLLIAAGIMPVSAELLTKVVTLDQNIHSVANTADNGPAIHLDIEPRSVVRRIGYNVTVGALHPAASIDPSIGFTYQVGTDVAFMDVYFTNDMISSLRTFNIPLTPLASLPRKSMTHWPTNGPIQDGQLHLAFLDWQLVNRNSTVPTGKITGTITIEYETPPDLPHSSVLETARVKVPLDKEIYALTLENPPGGHHELQLPRGTIVRKIGYIGTISPYIPDLDPAISLAHNLEAENFSFLDIFFRPEEFSVAANVQQALTPVQSLPYASSTEWPAGAVIADGRIRVAVSDFKIAHFGMTNALGKFVGELDIEYQYPVPFPIRITSWQMLGNEVTLTWNAEIDRRYWIQESPDLVQWTYRQDAKSTGASCAATLTRTAYPNGKGFFRVITTPPP